MDSPGEDGTVRTDPNSTATGCTSLYPYPIVTRNIPITIPYDSLPLLDTMNIFTNTDEITIISIPGNTDPPLLPIDYFFILRILVYGGSILLLPVVIGIFLNHYYRHLFVNFISSVRNNLVRTYPWSTISPAVHVPIVPDRTVSIKTLYGNLKPINHNKSSPSINSSTTSTGIASLTSVLPSNTAGTRSVRDLTNKFGGNINDSSKKTGTGNGTRIVSRVPFPVNKYPIPSLLTPPSINNQSESNFYVPTNDYRTDSTTKEPLLLSSGTASVTQSDLSNTGSTNETPDDDENEDEIPYDEIFPSHHFPHPLPVVADKDSGTHNFALSISSDNQSFAITNSQKVWKYKVPVPSTGSILPDSITNSTTSNNNPVYEPASPIVYAAVLTRSFPHTTTVRHRLSTPGSKRKFSGKYNHGTRASSPGTGSLSSAIEDTIPKASPSPISLLALPCKVSTTLSLSSNGADSSLPTVDIQKYVKMLQVGIPRPAVEKKMQLDGTNFTMADIDRSISIPVSSSVIPTVLSSSSVLVHSSTIASSPTEPTLPLRPTSSINNALALKEIQAIFAKKQPSSSPVIPILSPTASTIASVPPSSTLSPSSVPIFSRPIDPPSSSSSPTVARVILFDSKKATNMGILLAKFRNIPYDKLVMAIETQSWTISIDGNRTVTLSPQQIELLLALIPPPGDIKIVQRYMDQQNEVIHSQRLGEAEKFTYALSKVDRLREKIVSLAYRANYAERYTGIVERSKTLEQFTVELGKDSKLLALVRLSVGILEPDNTNTVSLSTIVTRIIDKGTNFRKLPPLTLQWIQSIRNHDRQAFTFTIENDLPTVKSVMESKITDIDRELITLLNGLTNLYSPPVGSDAFPVRTVNDLQTEIHGLRASYTVTYQRLLQRVVMYGIEINDFTSISEMEKITGLFVTIQKLGHFIRQLPNDLR